MIGKDHPPPNLAPDGRPFPTARPAMRGPYLIRNPMAAAMMGTADLVLNAALRRQPPMPREPRGILLCNWAHLGDVLLTLPAADWLQRRFPEAEFGFLAGSWSAPVLADAGAQFSRVHVVDHQRLNRSGDAAARRLRHQQTARVAIQEIRAARYDLAIDFYPFFPNAGLVLWRAGVPVRVGWTSGGLGGFFSHRVRRFDANRHVIDYQRDLLALVDPLQAPASGALVPAYPRSGPPPRLPPPLDDGQPYVLLHTGAGDARKEWRDDRWALLAKELRRQRKRVVLVGAGAREATRNATIAAANAGVVDLTGALGWDGLVSVVERCEALFCLDSVAGHIAAAFARPVVSIAGGMTNPRQWGPASPNVAMVTFPTPCAPCNRMGCEQMYCLGGVEVDDVLRAAVTLNVLR